MGKRKKPEAIPPVGLHVQAKDGSYVRAPDGLVDSRMTIRELAAKAFDSGMELHFQLVAKPPGAPRDTTSTFPTERRRRSRSARSG